jgi:trk system potassium uptake protein
MNSPLAVTALIGRVLMLFSLVMGVPLAFALAQRDPAELAFLTGIGVTLLAGGGLRV